MGHVSQTERIRPYKERGDRLRTRKDELIRTGQLPNDLTKIAKAAGVSVSGFQQWERGETWPRKEKRAKLAQLMGWSEIELDFGTQAAERRSEMFHPVAPDEIEAISLLRALKADPQLHSEAMRYLRSKVAAMHTMQKEVTGGQLRSPSDEHVAAHLGRPAKPLQAGKNPRKTR